MNNDEHNIQNNLNQTNQYNQSNIQQETDGINNAADIDNKITGINGIQNSNGYNGKINNMNNSFNNENNNVNNFQKNINGRKKIFIIIIGLVSLIILGVIIIMMLKGRTIGTNKNATGSTEYNSSDVDFSCVYESSNDEKKSEVYSDFIFNYKSSGSQYNYQLKIYNKMIIEYKNGLTDSKYKDFIDTFNSMECISNECTENHLELGTTDSGWDTVVDRIGDKIEVTYYNIYGMGITATKDDMKDIKDKYENNGFVCN